MLYRVEVMFEGEWTPFKRNLDAGDAECWRAECERHRDVARIVEEDNSPSDNGRDGFDSVLC